MQGASALRTSLGLSSESSGSASAFAISESGICWIAGVFEQDASSR